MPRYDAEDGHMKKKIKSVILWKCSKKQARHIGPLSYAVDLGLGAFIEKKPFKQAYIC